MDMLHAATCFATLRKVKDISTSLATRNATLVAVAGCKTRMLHVKFFLQLVSQQMLRDKLQEKLPRVTWLYLMLYGLNAVLKCVLQKNCSSAEGEKSGKLAGIAN